MTATSRGSIFQQQTTTDSATCVHGGISGSRCTIPSTRIRALTVGRMSMIRRLRLQGSGRSSHSSGESASRLGDSRAGGADNYVRANARVQGEGGGQRGGEAGMQAVGTGGRAAVRWNGMDWDGQQQLTAE